VETRLYNECAVPILYNTRKVILQFKYTNERNDKRQYLKLH